MILLTQKPEINTRQTSAQKSRWNTAHNRTLFYFQRRDYSVAYTIPMMNNTLALHIPTAESADIEIGDGLYIDGYGIAYVNFIQTVTPTLMRFGLNVQYTGIQVEYANAMKREGYAVHVRVTTKNAVSGIETIHPYDTIYPNSSGVCLYNPNGRLLREFAKKNLHPYTGVNWNDKRAWTSYTIEYRESWLDNNEQFWSAVASNQQFSGELTQNPYFTYNSTHWALTNVLWKAAGMITKPSSSLLGEAYAATAIASIVGGRTYRVIVTIQNQSGIQNNSACVRIMTASGNWYDILVNGTFEWTFTAAYNNEDVWVRIDAGINAEVTTFAIQEQTTLPPSQYLPIRFYASNSVKQIQSDYGVNLTEHLCVYATIASAANRGKFISDFEKPTKFKNYPFDIGFIMHDSMQYANASVKEELKNQSGVATGIDTFALADLTEGEHRLQLSTAYSDSDTAIDVWIEAGAPADNLYVDEQYVDAGYVSDSDASEPVPPAQTGELMQRMTIKLDNKCKENPVYLAWRGSLGAMNYWLFSKTQTIGADIEDEQVFQPFNETLDTDTRLSVLNKRDTPTMVVGAQLLKLEDIKGLAGLTRSTFVQMYIGYNGTSHVWQTVRVKAGSFKYYETGNGLHEIELSLELPERYTHKI